MLTREQSNRTYAKILKHKNRNIADLRELMKHDLFFLLTVAIGRKDINRDWLYERIREVEQNPYNHLDLWARDHYKSTIITYGGTIQEILNDPEITACILSHNQRIARAFVTQIKRTFESCDDLKLCFPEIFFAEPHKEAPKWSEQDGLIVKRTTNPKEATIEGHGLGGGNTTGRHYKLIIYDDIVTQDSVTTPEQILKTTQNLELSYSLASQGCRYKYIGTRYHANDTWQSLLNKKTVTPRIHTATDDGTDTGKPVFLSKEQNDEKRANMGPYTYACQMLQNPLADKAMGFQENWIKYYEPEDEYIRNMNRIIIVDPASKRKKSSDYTVMAVIGYNEDKRRYLIYGIRDRLNLKARSDKLFALVRKFEPQKVLYEEYAMQADIEFIEMQMEEKNYRFDIEGVGGKLAKEDRIKALIPHFEQGRFILPRSSAFVDYERNWKDFTQLFIHDEYINFPVCSHDDMLDCLARSVFETGISFPDPTGDLREHGMIYTTSQRQHSYDINRLTNKDYRSYYGF